MRTDIAIDKLCDICPVIADISEKATTDNELREALIAAKSASKTGILKIIPVLKKKCEIELYTILGIISGKNIDDIKAQPFADTIKQVVALISDKDFTDFFSSFLGNTEQEKPAETLSTTLKTTEHTAVDYEP